MDKELKTQLDEFISLFFNQKVVIQFLNIKKEIENSQEIISLQKNLNDSKKQLALSFGRPDYHEKKELYIELQSQYDNHPLIVNYNFLKEEITYLLDEIENKLQIK